MKSKPNLKNTILLSVLITGILSGCNGAGGGNNQAQPSNQGAVNIVPLPGRANVNYLKDTNNGFISSNLSIQGSAGTDITAANAAVTTAKNIATAVGFGSEFLGPLSIFTREKSMLLISKLVIFIAH